MPVNQVIIIKITQRQNDAKIASREEKKGLDIRSFETVSAQYVFYAVLISL